MEQLKKIISKVFKKRDHSKSKMIVLHKKQITAVSLLILVGVAGYLNWSFQQDVIDPEVTAVYNEVSKKLGEAQMVNSTPEVKPTENTEDYFSQSKMERDIRRSESIDMLTAILNTQETDKEGRKRAEDEIHKLVDYTEKEIMIENLIKGKGYQDVVAFMGDNLISIAVKSNGLNEIDAAILQDIAVSTTNYSASEIKIVEIK